MKAWVKNTTLGCIWGGICLAISACQGVSNRQDALLTRSSGYSEVLPNAPSVEGQYIPSKDGDPPMNAAAYHITPTVSYEDRTLDENLASFLEVRDYYAALRVAGFQPYLQSSELYTVMAMPNKAMEAYVKTWPNPDWRAPENREKLKRFIAQSILIGKWDFPKIKQEARYYSNTVTADTLNDTYVVLQPVTSSGSIAVQGPAGQVRLVGQSYPQSNGILYITDSVLPAPPF